MNKPPRAGLAAAVVAVAVGGLAVAAPAMAQDSAAIQALQQQIVQMQQQQRAQMQALQGQLRKLQADAAARDAALKKAQDQADAATAKADAAAVTANKASATIATAPSAPPFAPPPEAFLKNGPCGGKYAAPDPNTPSPTFCLGNVSVTLGGFIDLTFFDRSRNETAGLTTSWAGIPFANSSNYHIGELRASSQYSRLSIELKGHAYDTGTFTAYFEGDLNASGVNATTIQTNSYSPRVRQAFAELDDTSWGGVHLIAGQAYSLATPNAFSVLPRKEQLPLTIDSGYVPGFVYTRQPQVRVVKDLPDGFAVAASLETPQTLWAFNSGTAGKATSSVTTMPAGIGALSGATLDLSNAGSGGLNTTANYSIDSVPDIIVKASSDPGFGHYEVYGLGRVFNDRLAMPGRGSNKSTFGGGIGAATTIPVVPSYLDLTGNVLAGYGIGRYGAGQLPDATVGKDGAPVPLPEVEALVGLIGHVTPKLDLFGYGGVESVGRKSFNVGSTGYGYGSPLFDNTGCSIELSTVCPGSNVNTHALINGTIGGWYRIAHGGFGTFMTGAEYAYVKRELYSGKGGSPSTDENLFELSLRYLPWQ
jgi:hypothetical protein